MLSDSKLDTVENVDCLKGMMDMPNACVDVIFTDPPYGIGKEYQGHEDEQRPELDVWLECWRILKPGGSLHMTVSNKHLNEWIDYLTSSGFHYKHCSVYWNQGRAGGNYTGQFAYAWEPWLHFTKPDSKGKTRPVKLVKRMMTDVMGFNANKETQHPCERDLPTWKKMLDLIDGQIVFDPFMGSGTTAIAAIELGRSYYGFEKSKEYFDLIMRRTANAKAQGDLFSLKNQGEML